MDYKQNLYYALGILAYAVAKVDGEVQREERQVVHDIVAEETEHTMDYSYMEIIFHILQKEDRSFEQVYEWALKYFELGKYHFTSQMKEQFIRVIERVADAAESTSQEEKDIIERFKKDLNALETNLIN